MLVNFIRLVSLYFVIVTISCEDSSPEYSFAATIYNHYKQCESDTQMLPCLKLKVLKLVDKVLAINNIPIVEGISLKKEENYRSLDDADLTPIDENSLLTESYERNRKLDFLLWERMKFFFDTRSLQFKVDKLFQSNDSSSLENGRSASRVKKDKKGNHLYVMLMKGGLMVLAYKALAFLASKALLISKIALTLAILLAIKKFFGNGHHSHQKTTYEIVKTPIISQSPQYSNAAPQSGHYSADFSNYESPPYARSLENREEGNRRIGMKAVDAQTPRYVAHITETIRGRSVSDMFQQDSENKGSFDDSLATATEINWEKLDIPYAHLAAYRHQLQSKILQVKTSPTEKIPTAA